ncbi:MAG TPA: hypothetical protein VKB55_12650 [Nocardioidaceae bacterium]|nr:hypothetical protein [Nocardioidaceae bacterium]
MARVLIVLLIAVGAVACGGGGGGGSADPSGGSDGPSQSASASAGAGSDSGSGSGAASAREDAASDLSEFVCQPDADGRWNASGVITNSSGQAADYRVTVVVADGPGDSLEGKRRTLTALAPDTPEQFDIKRLPADGASDSACQVQVLRLH